MENNNLRNQGVPFVKDGTQPTPTTAPAAVTPLFADVTRTAPVAATPTPVANSPIAAVPLAAPTDPIPPATPPTPAPTPTTAAAPVATMQPKKRRDWRKIALGISIGATALLILIGGILVFEAVRNRDNSQVNNSQLANTTIPLSDFASTGSLALLGTQSLAVNGQLRANESFVLAPQAQPTTSERGQMYYDAATNRLAYFNGSTYIQVASQTDLSTDTVLSLQGQTGDITLVAGPGVAVTGTTLTNTGVTALGGATGDIALGTGLTLTSGTLQNSGVISATAGSNISVINDGNGNITISNTGGGTGTVTSPNGTPGRIAKFTGVQTIEDSLLSEAGTTVTVNGSLSVTGSLSLGTPLSVNNGGTGATALAANGVVVGNGAGALTAVTAGGAGECLMSTAGTPTFTACPGGGGVLSLNSLTGALSIANASAGGSTITINDATTGAKGIASYNGTNFSVSGGVVNTIQDIAIAAAPTFGRLTLTSSQASNAMLLINNTNAGASGNLLDVQLNGASRLAVTPAGAMTLTGTLNGQTISSTANFTGTLAVTGATSLNGGANVAGTLTANTITPSSALTVGATTQSFLLQGNASSTITATNAGSTTAVAFQTPTANVTYRLLTAAAGTYDICTTVGNCAGVGGGVTTAGGTTNQLAKFTGSNAIGDSIITDNGTTVTIGGTLAVNTITPAAAMTIGATSQDLTLQGADTTISATDSGTANTLVFATPSGSNKTITIPNATGTVAVSASGPLAIDASGNITCASCVTNGGGNGGVGAVDSLNGLTGTLALANASGSGSTITINDASTSQKGIAQFNSTNFSASGGIINTIQNIATTAAPTFGQLTLTSSQASAAMLTVNNTNVSASGNLIDLQLNGSSRFAVTPAGAMTVTSTINGQTIGSAANFTGTLAVAGTASLNGGASVTGTLTANTITPTSSLTVGASSQTFLLQGNAGSTITATNAGNTSALAFQTPTANVTYRLLTASAGTYDICTTVGNCAGVGGGVTTAGGTSGRIAKFTSSGSIGDSIMTESGTTITVAGTAAATTALQAPLVDTASAGVLAIGTTNATAINLNQNTVLAAGKSLTITGGNTASRPGSPTEGMLYFDTDTDRLLVYANGKWQADRSTATKIVAMGSPSSCSGAVPVASQNADAADFVVNSCTSAQTTIAAAIAALPSGGGTIYLMEGTYIIDNNINMTSKDNVTIKGAGVATVLKFKNSTSGGTDMFYTTSDNLEFAYLKLDGNRSGNTNGTQLRAFLVNSATTNVNINNIWVEGFYSNAVFVDGTQYRIDNIYATDNNGHVIMDGSHGILTNSILENSYGDPVWALGESVVISNNRIRAAVTNQTAIQLQSAHNSTVTGNVISDHQYGIWVSGNNTSVTGNTITASTAYGINVGTSTNSNIADNTITNSGGSGSTSSIRLQSGATANNIIDNNITDTAGTGHAIEILSGATRNYLAGNTYSGTGATTISDAGTDTVYANQLQNDGTLAVKTLAGGTAFGKTTANGTVAVQGSYVSSALSSPAAPTVSNIGAAGSTSYTYAVSAFDGVGETLISTTTATATGNATLNGTNYNRVSWARVGGAISYRVYRTASSGTPSSTGLIGTVLAGSTAMQLNDTGLAASGSTPSANTTGGMSLAGGLQGTTAVFGSANALTLGTSSSATGSINFKGSGGTGSITLVGQANPTGARTIALPDEDGTVCLQNSSSCGFLTGAAAGGSFIQNQNASQQTSSNFWISGTGRADTSLQSPLIDTPTATALNIGTTNATAINLNQNTTINGGATGDALTVTNSASTGNIAVFKDNTLTVASIADGGAAIFKNSANSSAAFAIQNAASGSLFNVDSANSNINMLANNSGEVEPWQTTTAFSSTRSKTNAVVVNGYMYMVGGSLGGGATTTVDYAKINTDGTLGAWGTTTSLPTSNDRGTAVTANGYVYYMGGATSDKVYYAKANSDGTLGAWKTAKSMPDTRYNMTAVVAKGYLYVLGGVGTSGSQSTVLYTKLNGDGSVGDWKTAANALPATRVSAQSATANGYLYAIGGSSASTVYYAQINNDGSVGTWSTAANALPLDRGRTAAIILNGYVYIAGGANGGNTESSTVYYARLNANGSVGTWSTAANALPAVRAYQGMVAANGFMYAVGGMSSISTEVSTVYYTSTPRVKIGGSLDLVGFQGQNLADPSETGGSITAGNGTFVGTMQVQGQANFASSVNVNGALSADTATVRTSVNSTNAFQVQNSAGTGIVNISTSTTANLVANPDFELNATGWTAKGTPTSVAVSNEFANFGSRSLKVVTGTVADSGVQYRYSFAPSTQYTLSFWARRDTSTSAATFNIGRADNGSDSNCLAAQTFDTTWRQFTCTFTTGATMGTAAHFYIKQFDTVSDNIYIDGVTMVTGSSALAYTARANNLEVEPLYSKVTLNGSNSGEVGSWQTSSNTLPAARWGAGSVVANGYVYVVGGNAGITSQSTVYYAKLNSDGSTGAWQTAVNALPQGRGAFVSIAANGYLYAIGGYNPAGNAQSTVYYAKLNSDGSVGTWQTSANALPAVRYAASGAVANGYAYVIGGGNASTAELSTVYYAKLNSDGSTGAWQTAVNALPAARATPASVTANGYVYVIGGRDGSTNTTTAYYAKLNGDGSVGTWSTGASALPTGLYQSASAQMNGYVYVMGGMNNSSAVTATVYYAKLNGDGTTSAWSTAANSMPSARRLTSFAATNGYVYVMGGKDSGSTDQATTYYASTSRLLVGGSLDLVGGSDGDLSEGDGVGGSITAGNGTFVGGLQVQGQASFANNVNITGTLGASEATFKNAADSTGAFKVLNAAATDVFSVDTTNSRLQIGSVTADSTGALLVLDTKNTAGDPTGVAGGMYYNSNTSKFRCYNSTWVDCITAGGSTTNIQFNDGGSMGGEADLVWDKTANTLTLGGTDTGIIIAGASNEPSAPSAGNMQLYTKSIAGRTMFKTRGPSGTGRALQPSLFSGFVGIILPQGSSSPSQLGLSQTVSGTGNTTSVPAKASTNLRTSMHRWDLNSGASSNNSADLRGPGDTFVWRGNAAGMGGFFYSARFAVATTTANQRVFVGLNDETSTMSSSLSPSSQINVLGFGWDSADSNMQVMYNDGSGSATKIDLGASFPANSTTAVYDVKLYSPPNGSSIGYEVTRLDTGTVASGTLSTDLPSNSTFLNYHTYINNGGTAAISTLEMMHIYIESDH